MKELHEINPSTYKTNYSPSFTKRLQQERRLACNFIQDQQKNINECKQARNIEENAKNEVLCMILDETDTQCRAVKFEIQLGINEMELECNPYIV